MAFRFGGRVFGVCRGEGWSSLADRPKVGPFPETAIQFRNDRWRWHAPSTAPESLPRGATAWELERRGTRHGIVTHAAARRLDAPDARAAWDAARPVHLRGAFGDDYRRLRPAIARTVRTFRRFRSGTELRAELWRRLGDDTPFEPAGTSVDLGDEREIEKVHADLRRNGRLAARDLWAKLSWISPDERDVSMRVRFSFGAEQLDEWMTDTGRARAADDLAEAVFPECRLLSESGPVGRLLEQWAGTPLRLSERIVFSNAPGGGARFHHDAEEGQLGVAYAQLAGRTAWLAIPKRELAEEVARLDRGTASPSGAGILDDADRPDRDRILNGRRVLTRRLVERGCFFVLSPGDALVLPSHGPEDAAWHSVFALGAEPSLALSFGVFRRRARRSGR